MKINKFLIGIMIFFSLFTIFSISSVIAFQSNSTNYINYIDIGNGDNISSTNYQQVISIGESLIGNTSSTNYQMSIGFINIIPPVVSAVSNITPVIPTSGGGGGIFEENLSLKYNNTIICPFLFDFLLKYRNNTYKNSDIENLTNLINIYYTPNLEVYEVKYLINIYDSICPKKIPTEKPIIDKIIKKVKEFLDVEKGAIPTIFGISIIIWVIIVLIVTFIIILIFRKRRKNKEKLKKRDLTKIGYK